MHSRIKTVFKTCADQKRAALVAYITGGDPNLSSSAKIAKAVIDAGADIIEIGLPFSDPLADGEANQLASERALDSGATVISILDEIAIIRSEFPDIPIVIFTYLNPIAFSAIFTFDEFCAKAVNAGADAILCLDITPEEDKSEKSINYSATLKKYGLDSISLITPNTPENRIKTLAKFASSFIYYVSREGVTGESKVFIANFADRIELIRKYTALPIVVGFGISTPEHVKIAAKTGVNGVVVGSAIVRKIEAFSKGQGGMEEIKTFVSELKKGVHNG